MPPFARRILAPCFVLGLTASCAGSGNTFDRAANILPPNNHVGQTTNATFIIRLAIPLTHARFVAASTQGLSASLTGPTNASQAFSVAAGALGCTESKTQRTCSLQIKVDAGQYKVAVTTYDKAPVNGKFPATAKMLAQFVDAAFKISGNSYIPFALDGIPASLAIDALAHPAAGSKSKTPITVVVKDADGNIILGTYANRVALATADASGTTSILTSGTDKPPAGTLLSSSDTAAVSYTGLATRPIEISASAPGVKTVFALFSPSLNPIGPSTLTGGVYIDAIAKGADERARGRRPHAYGPSFTASESGWTNAPFNKPLTAKLSSGCSTIVTVTPSSGTAFAVVLVDSPTNGSCTLTLSDGAGQKVVIPIGFQKFAYTGAPATFDVPAGVTLLSVAAVGAGGGFGCQCGLQSASGDLSDFGGAGGLATGALAVQSQSVLNVTVGGQGGNGTGYASATAGAGGFNGGGNGGTVYGGGPSDSSGAGGGGGGASSVSSNDNLLLIAGGGGGGGGFCDNGSPSSYAGFASGGSGDQISGDAGATCENGKSQGGGGGTQSAAGSGGIVCSSCARPHVINAGSSGSGTTGGAGGTGSESSNSAGAGGGGGGGYYGGGGGAGGVGGSSIQNAAGAGGGAGSSWVTSTATNANTSSSSNNGNGVVVIAW